MQYLIRQQKHWHLQRWVVLTTYLLFVSTYISILIISPQVGGKKWQSKNETNECIYFYLQIAKDAKECVQECVSEFISFITSEASERCAQEKRKTINGEDVLFAMGTLGFDPYIAPLKIYLQKYRDVSTF